MFPFRSNIACVQFAEDDGEKLMESANDDIVVTYRISVIAAARAIPQNQQEVRAIYVLYWVCLIISSSSFFTVVSAG